MDALSRKSSWYFRLFEGENVWFRVSRALKEAANSLSTHDEKKMMTLVLVRPARRVTNPRATGRNRTRVLGVAWEASILPLRHCSPIACTIVEFRWQSIETWNWYHAMWPPHIRREVTFRIAITKGTYPWNLSHINAIRLNTVGMSIEPTLEKFPFQAVWCNFD